MNRKQKTRYLLAIYLVVAFIAVILGLFAFNRDNDTWQSVLLNLSTELLGVVFLFFLVNYLFLIDDWNLSERVEKLITRIESMNSISNRRALLTAFSSELQAELENKLLDSKDLLILGVILGNTLDFHYHVFEEKLIKGDTIRVVTVDPDNPACAMTALRKYREVNLDVWRSQVLATLDALQELKRKTSGKLEIRIIDFPLANGGIYIDPTSPTGTYFLWYYSFKTRKGNRPKFVIRPTDEYWYEYFQEEAGAIWACAVPWEGTGLTNNFTH